MIYANAKRRILLPFVLFFRFQEILGACFCADIIGMLLMFMKHDLLMKVKFDRLLVCWTRHKLSYQKLESCFVGSALNRIRLIRLALLLVSILSVIHAGQSIQLRDSSTTTQEMNISNEYVMARRTSWWAIGSDLRAPGIH
ncbi:hypothetical protein HanIR_Chr11g0542081 [Helianthus annuus]|nr:hypothetical protein HanIR_Chr11g0542081 [Helianthus annuus]